MGRSRLMATGFESLTYLIVIVVMRMITKIYIIITIIIVFIVAIIFIDQATVRGAAGSGRARCGGKRSLSPPSHP